MMRTVFAVALATCGLGGCADYYDPAYYDEPNYGRVRGPNTFEGEVYYQQGIGGYRRRDFGDDYDVRGRDRDRKQRMVIEDAQYESVNGKRIDANRYVRDECHGENNCDVKASNKIFGDPDVGARKDLVVRYRCGKGPSRTMRVPEKSERDIKC
ncbi:MAG: hypothetical protein JNM81_16325 [Rhodospirillaceae bacterium]|nr:hypothetical protein [Rhodospirillaceae bacterium]